VNPRPIILLIFLVCTFGLYSQSIISGHVNDENQIALVGASVTIGSYPMTRVLAYDVSNQDGYFSISVNSNLDSLILKVSFLGFQVYTKKISNKTNNFQIALATSTIALKEVVLNSRPIEKKGDTLSYSVSAFKDQRDRVIADVIRKMPGIEIQPTGQILYLGKPIQKYYIEGHDLLEGRYNLANENLSANAVMKVQILENHQPIKVLDSLEFSERASLNIRLKNGVTLSGSAKAGSGLAPILWDVNITPMIFTKKIQSIVSYQSNNIGDDKSRAIKNFYSEDTDSWFRGDKKNWVFIRQFPDPPFPQELWLDNNAHLGSANFSYKFNSELDLKLNVSYLNDVQNQIGETETRFFTPNDTVNLTEKISNDLFTNALKSNLILERNTEKNYFKNELIINGFWDSHQGSIIRTNGKILQDLKSPFSTINNKLNILKPFGRQLITIKSNTGYTRTTDFLNIFPAQFTYLPNEENLIGINTQFMESSNFFTDNSLGFTKALGDFTISPKIGVSLQNQNLKSQLRNMGQNLSLSSKDYFKNNLDFRRLIFYFSSDFIYVNGSWEFRLRLPLSNQLFEIEDMSLKEVQNNNYLVFEPNLYLRKKISPLWENSLSVNITNEFANIDAIHFGYFLRDYRTLLRYNAPLLESIIQNYAYDISFRNPLKAIFTSATYSYNRTKNNLLFTHNINDDGGNIIEAIYQDNISNSHSFNIRTSKNLRTIKSTFTLGLNYTLNLKPQIINEVFTDIKNENTLYSFKIDSEITNWSTISYDANLMAFKTKLQSISFERIVTQTHKLDVNFYPTENQYLNIRSELYSNNLSSENSSVYFLSMGYRYTFKNGMDLNVNWRNVLNQEKYINVFNTEYSYIQNTYRLRPSQLLFGLRFSF
tara:strand:+ start:4061 stop:6700 length:2640 start_codon:yes stop_codon:yes gene_type:complete